MKKLLATLGFLITFLTAYAASASIWLGDSYTFNIQAPSVHTDAYCDHWAGVTFDNPATDYLTINYNVPPMGGNITLTVKVIQYFTGTKTITMTYTRVYGMPNYPFYEQGSMTFSISCKKVYVTLVPSELELEIGQTFQLGYTFQTSSIGNPNPTPMIQSFSTSNINVAKVNGAGLVTAIGAGQATITVKTNYNTTDKCIVTVLAVPTTGICLNKSSMILKSGSQRKLIATVIPSNATNNKVTWSSSNPAVLTVDQNGNIKAIKAGEAIITAKTSDGTNLSDTCKVTIYDGDIDGSNSIDIEDVSAIIDAIFNNK